MQTFRMFMTRAALLAAMFAMAAGASAQGGPGYGGGGGNGGGKPPAVGEDTGPGNNLSVPVVFAEGRGLGGALINTAVAPSLDGTGLRPTAADTNNSVEDYFDTSSVYLLDGITYFPQQTTSHWRASWAVGSSTAPEPVIVNWSDNLINQKWTTKAVIRVETVLYQNNLTGLKSFPMNLLYGSGSTEMQGTTGLPTYTGTYRTVYSICPRLTIQKITGQGGTPVGDPYFTGAVHEAFGNDGPGFYTAEINVGGSVIYGYNWMIGQMPGTPTSKLGWWRLTFSLDAACPVDGVPVAPNVTFAARDALDLNAVYFVPQLPNSYTSYIDIQIVDSRKGGRKPTNPGGGEK